MSKKLYDLMDWEAIEAIVYADEAHPKRVLGPREVRAGILIQCFFPGVDQVALLGNGQTYEMTREDERGFFAALLPGGKIPDYRYRIGEREVEDPYRFESSIDGKMRAQFHAGLLYDCYERFGAHPRIIDGVRGTSFLVWAPGAARVSVVGNFNAWDGRCHPMEKDEASGLFELFIPGVKAGALYKYEVRQKGGAVVLKNDPVAFAVEEGAEGAGKVCDLSSFAWKDDAWPCRRREKGSTDQPLYICKIDPSAYESGADMLEKVEKDVKHFGYTHVEFAHVGERSYFFSLPFLAPREAFMGFVDRMHSRGVGVILDIAPSRFTREVSGLYRFDGTNLYGEEDITRRKDVLFGDYVFRFGSPQVCNYLISSVLFMIEYYHIDGFKVDMLDTLLYLNYGRKEGEWHTNIYGGPENLEAIEFVKHLTSIVKKRRADVLLIAEETSGYPEVTGALAGGGLGFDYKYNHNFGRDLLDYMCLDPLYRGAHHEELLLSMVYAYSERFIVGYPYRRLCGRDALLGEMPGDEAAKQANLRLMQGYLVVHPGGKVVSQDAGTSTGTSFLDVYMRTLIALYKAQPALFVQDASAEGFEWIDNLEWEKNLLVFLRRSGRVEDTLLVVCNFSGKAFDKLPVGVPCAGKYKEIFNSDARTFGGTGFVNPRVKMSKKLPVSEREDSIQIRLAALSLAVFSYTKADRRPAAGAAAKSHTGGGSSEQDKGLKEQLAEAAAKEEQADKKSGRKE